MAADPTGLLIPEADFVPEIDYLLEKHRPSLTVPWSLHAVPAWAKDFKPRRILDIGAGLGAFTSSYVDCMNHWSCLTQLSEVVLLDGEQALFRPTLAEGIERVCQRVRAKLGSDGAAEVRFDVRNAEVVGDRVVPLDELPWQADLIVASHVTYYIGDGSGLEFVRVLAERHLAPRGLIWLVIRRLHCPIYEVRSRTLAAMGREDPKPLDYAERFQALAEKLTGVRIVENRTMRFAIQRKEEERLRAIHLLMWRSGPDEAGFPQGMKGAREAGRAAAPFHEEHFVLKAA